MANPTDVCQALAKGAVQNGTLVATFLTVSLPRSKSTFSQPFKEKCINEVVRIGSIIIFHPSKL